MECSIGTGPWHKTNDICIIHRFCRKTAHQGANVAAPNSTFASIHLVTNTATSDYDALQLQFQRRLSGGLQALASYTWSHLIDSASAGSFFGNEADNFVPGIASNANREPSDKAEGFWHNRSHFPLDPSITCGGLAGFRMELLYFLDQRLRFIQKLYDSTASSFEEKKRQIEAGEPPYVDCRDAEYVDVTCPRKTPPARIGDLTSRR